MAVKAKLAVHTMLTITVGLVIGMLGFLSLDHGAKHTKADTIIGFGFDLRCIKENWGSNDQANLEVVAACERTNHGGRGVSKFMAQSFLGQLNSKPRGWLSPSSSYSKKPAIRMMADSVEDQLTELIAEQLSVDAAKVTPDASFTDDLGADSLDAVEMIMAIEEKFGIEIPDEEAEKMTTPGQCAEAVKSKMS